MGTLPVIEIAGPTIHGVGWRAARILLAGCNLTCDACDSRYTWDGSEQSIQVTPDAIMSNLSEMREKYPFRLVVITGGEPLIHQHDEAFRSLIVSLLSAGISVEIETNGTILPLPWMEIVIDGRCHISFVVSPKVTGQLATNDEDRRIKPHVIRWFNRHDQVMFKIVARTAADVDTIGNWADANGVARHKIWIMAEGNCWSDHITRSRTIVDRALRQGMNLSTRIHLLLWPTATIGR